MLHFKAGDKILFCQNAWSVESKKKITFFQKNHFFFQKNISLSYKLRLTYMYIDFLKKLNSSGFLKC